jgi:CubicO group peptidase (beta-lactamase class C family)
MTLRPSSVDTGGAMRRVGWWLALGFGVSSPAVGQGIPGPSDWVTLAAVVDSVMAAEMAERHIPGAAFVFVQDGRIRLARGYGWARLEPRRPVSPDSTVWRIGSISKAFTALAVTQLADRGRIDLHADVNRYLRRLRIPDTFPEPVTAAHLLTHTAGFDEIRPGTQADDSAGILPLADFLRPRLVRLWRPGRVIMYSTYGITLAGLLVEDVSGLTYEQYLRRNVWEPLGMTRTGIGGPRTFGADQAQGYEWDEGTQRPARWEWYHTTPASSILASAADMGRFMIGLLGGAPGADTALLSRRGWTEFRRTHVTMHPRIAGMAYGLLEERPSDAARILTHGGDVEGFSADMVLFPDLGQGWFVVSHVEGNALRQRLKQALLDRFYRRPAVAARLPALTRRPSPPSGFTGQYGWNAYCHTCPGGQPYTTLPVGTDDTGALVLLDHRWIETRPRFFVRADGKDSLALLADSTGRITHLAWPGWWVFERLPGAPPEDR